jgi:hypothetical protein
MRDSADSDGYGITRRGKERGKFTMTSRPTPSAAGTCAGYDVCLATRSSRQPGACGPLRARPLQGTGQQPRRRPGRRRLHRRILRYQPDRPPHPAHYLRHSRDTIQLTAWHSGSAASPAGAGDLVGLS